MHAHNLESLVKKKLQSATEEKISLLEATHPREFRLETGRLTALLAGHPQGLSKSELLEVFYPQYSLASEQLKQSLELCLAKLLQRTRTRLACLGVDVHFCRRNKCWKIDIQISQNANRQGQAQKVGHHFISRERSPERSPDITWKNLSGF